jgi:hypothetical protein
MEPTRSSLLSHVHTPAAQVEWKRRVQAVEAQHAAVTDARRQLHVQHTAVAAEAEAVRVAGEKAVEAQLRAREAEAAVEMARHAAGVEAGKVAGQAEAVQRWVEDLDAREAVLVKATAEVEAMREAARARLDTCTYLLLSAMRLSSCRTRGGRET